MPGTGSVSFVIRSTLGRGEEKCKFGPLMALDFNYSSLQSGFTLCKMGNRIEASNLMGPCFLPCLISVRVNHCSHSMCPHKDIPGMSRGYSLWFLTTLSWSLGVKCAKEPDSFCEGRVSTTNLSFSVDLVGSTHEKLLEPDSQKNHYKTSTLHYESL